MRKIFLINLILPLFLFAQGQSEKPMDTQFTFISGNDTIPQITAQDTVYWVGGISGLNWPAWNEFTNYISAAEKVAEETQVYDLSAETLWTWYDQIRFKIVSGSTTLTSKIIPIGRVNGALTLFVQPDTMGTNTVYKVRFGGF